jgi:hypothetical protein
MGNKPLGEMGVSQGRVFCPLDVLNASECNERVTMTTGC